MFEVFSVTNHVFDCEVFVKEGEGSSSSQAGRNYAKKCVVAEQHRSCEGTKTKPRYDDTNGDDDDGELLFQLETAPCPLPSFALQETVRWGVQEGALFNLFFRPPIFHH